VTITAVEPPDHSTALSFFGCSGPGGAGYRTTSMKDYMKKIKAAILGIGTAGFFAGLSGCCNLHWTPKCPPKIVNQPQSVIAKKGATVHFTVIAVPHPLFYQWQFNGGNIVDATNATYTIAAVDLSKVGGYRALVWGSPTNTSDTAYLSVYTTATTGNGGTLTAPIGVFTNSGSCCSASFDKLHVYKPFDGPYASQPSPDFPNTSNSSTLTVDTLSNSSTLDTGVEIRQQTSPYTSWCNNDISSTTKLSQNTGTPLVNGQTYRVGVYYKSSTLPPGTTTIIWTWQY